MTKNKTMRRYSSDALSWYTFEALEPHPLRHAVFTRRGGRSAGRFASLNVGHNVGDDPAAVDSNHRLICQALGLSPHRIVTGRQVHGNGVAVVADDHAGQALPATDGLVTDVAGLALVLRFADCVPIFLYDPVRQAVGLGHAGWRGTMARLGEELLTTMQRGFGTRAEDVLAGLGPGIGPCCYRIGPEVVEQIERGIPEAGHALSERDGLTYFDLWEANRLQLAQLGVQPIEVSNLCTADQVEEFFSHRAEQGRTGRFAAVIALEPSA